MPDDSSESVSTNASHIMVPDRAARARPVPPALRLIRLGFSIGGALAPRLAARVAYRIWFTPTRFPTPVYEQTAMKSAEMTCHRIDDMNIACYSWGRSGPAVLLVHGWSGRGTQLYAFVEPLIDHGFRVLSFDCPAHGRSDGKQTNIFKIADVILALNDRCGPFESVITHSFGGPCLAIAMQQGMQTSSVVCLSPPADVAGLVEKFANTLSLPVKAKKYFVQRFRDDFGEDILERTSMVNTVRELGIPALVIHDQDDEDVPWQEGRAVAQAWKNARFVKTGALGHRRILRDASTIDTAVAFINQDGSAYE